MKTKTLIIVVSLSVGLLTGCTDKKKSEKKLEIETTSKQNKTTIEDSIDEVEKIRLDSIRQVKEHGHAH